MENNIEYSEEIEKVINQKNTFCALYGSPECRFLNAENCTECAVGKLSSDRQQEAKRALGALMEAAPQEEIEPLYTSEECLFCKGEHRNKAERFGLFDLAKRDAAGDWTFAIGKRKLGVKAQDMILPLQVSCCKECAKRHKLIAYLPMICALVICAAALILITTQNVYKALYSVASFMPALTMLLSAVIAFAVCAVMKRCMRNAFSKKTVLDVEEIPAVKKLIGRGFREVADKKQGVSTVVFARKLREHGVGSLRTGECRPTEGEPVLMGIWPAEAPEEETREEDKTAE